jgi:hypothetical protein
MPMTGQKLKDMEKQETAILVNQCLSYSPSAMHQSNFARETRICRA